MHNAQARLMEVTGPDSHWEPLPDSKLNAPTPLLDSDGRTHNVPPKGGWRQLGPTVQQPAGLCQEGARAEFPAVRILSALVRGLAAEQGADNTPHTQRYNDIKHDTSLLWPQFPHLTIQRLHWVPEMTPSPEVLSHSHGICHQRQTPPPSSFEGRDTVPNVIHKYCLKEGACQPRHPPTSREPHEVPVGMVVNEDKERVRVLEGVLQEGLEFCLGLGVELQHILLHLLLGHVLLFQAQLQ